MFRRNYSDRPVPPNPVPPPVYPGPLPVYPFPPDPDPSKPHPEPDDDKIVKLLKTIIEKLDNLTTLQEKIMATIADLQAEVAQETDVVASVLALIDGLVLQLQAAIAAADPLAVQAVLDQMVANREALAAAVTNNTPPAA